MGKKGKKRSPVEESRKKVKKHRPKLVFFIVFTRLVGRSGGVKRKANGTLAVESSYPPRTALLFTPNTYLQIRRPRKKKNPIGSVETIRILNKLKQRSLQDPPSASLTCNALRSGARWEKREEKQVNQWSRKGAAQ